MGTPGALAHIDDEMVLGRIRAGEHASLVAQSLGVHKSAISHRYKDNPAYLEARELGTEVRLNEIEAEIAALSKPLPQPEISDNGTDEQWMRYKVELKAWQMSHSEREFNLACARERGRVVSWRAGVEHPHRWGQKHEVIQSFTVTIEQTLSADARSLLQYVRGHVIEHDAIQDMAADDHVQPQQHPSLPSIIPDDSAK